MGRGRLYVVSAPSGAGKTSLVKALMEREPRIRFSVSYTTRAAAAQGDSRARLSLRYGGTLCRDGRARGISRACEGLRQLLRHRACDAVEEALANGEQLLLEIDWQGARQVRARLPEARSIFILPPSRSALEQRLKDRSTDSEAVIRRRLQDAAEDIRHWAEFDFVVVNDRFEQALADLQAIVEDRGRSLIAQRPEVARLSAELLANGAAGKP